MILTLLFRSLVRGKARFICAVAGIAVAAGAIAFFFSLAATNAAQAPALARQASAPFAAWQISRSDPVAAGERPGRGRPGPREAGEGPGRGRPGRGWEPKAPRADLMLPVVEVTLDYRPNGRVLQGPPMRAVIAPAPQEGSPWRAAPLVKGRWVDTSTRELEIVCTRGTLKRFGRGEVPPVGTVVKFVGMMGTMSARIVGYLEDAKLPPGWPGVFANAAAFKELAAERHGRLMLWRTVPEEAGSHEAPLLTPDSEAVMRGYRSDEVRRMDYARPLLLVAAVLTALCLLVHSLLLSLEANRKSLAILRTIGLTRWGVLRLVGLEALCATGVGWLIGTGVGLAALRAYVAFDAATFPMGCAVAWRAVGVTGIVACGVALAALAFVLAPALAVRPLDAQRVPARRRWGMAVVFACGFAAFVAVEVWGASLMRGFVPSTEWPDAIVSLLPNGVSAFEIEKLRALPGVKRISELLPLQLDFDPVEPMRMPGAPPAVEPGAGGPGMRGRGGMRRMNRNALFLASEWLPHFKFTEGNWNEASVALTNGPACVIAEMVARAHHLHKGDVLRVALGGREPVPPVSLPIVGVVDVNWHMVTSRGLVRGMNGAPGMTDGPVFVSFDTLESLDARPAIHVKMTHLWVEYDPAFLAREGVFPAGRQIEREIVKALGDPQDVTVRLHARDEIADGTLAHGSDVIGQAARVPFAFLVILSIGFIAMLVAEAEARRKSFRVLRAVGATHAQLVVRLAARAVRVALGGVVLGVPIGSLVGWLFAGKTAAMWAGMPHYFDMPVRVVVEGSLGALIVVLLIAVPTAWCLVRRARQVCD